MNDMKRRAIKEHNDAYVESKKPREEKPMTRKERPMTREERPMTREEKRRVQELLILLSCMGAGI